MKIVCMAGGGGTRLWPVSTNSFPKQFLSLGFNRSLLQQTYDRISSLIKPEDYFITANKNYSKLLEEQLTEIPKSNFFYEPTKRDNAAAVALTLKRLLHLGYRDEVMVMLPSDHFIKNTEYFKQILKTAESFIKENQKYILTIGIHPEYPETGYGYIEGTDTELYSDSGPDATPDTSTAGSTTNHSDAPAPGSTPDTSTDTSSDSLHDVTHNEIPATSQLSINKVKRFTEKPDKETAESFIKQGNFYWNSGMFVWHIGEMWKLFEKFLPEITEKLDTLDDILGTEEEDTALNNLYPTLRAISIDFAIMEKAQHIGVIPVKDLKWTDIGNWKSVMNLFKPDENGNVNRNKAILTDTRNSFTFDKISNSSSNNPDSKAKKIYMYGGQNLGIIQTDNEIFILDLDKSSDIKNFLKENNI